MSYPKRRYTSIQEVAVGDVVRMQRQDEHGNQAEVEAFSDGIILEVRDTVASVYRPHVYVLRNEIRKLGEPWTVELKSLVEHYWVMTTGHDGNKDNRHRVRVADITKPSVGYHHCACRDCFDLYVGEPDEFCLQCIEAGCEQDDTRDSECLRPETYGSDEEVVEA